MALWYQKKHLLQRMVGRVRNGGRVSRGFYAGIAGGLLRTAPVLCSLMFSPLCAQDQPSPPDQAPPIRRIPERVMAGIASLQGTVRDQHDRPVPGATLIFRSRSSTRSFTEVTNAEGIF